MHLSNSATFPQFVNIHSAIYFYSFRQKRGLPDRSIPLQILSKFVIIIIRFGRFRLGIKL
ncbi:hypothetical protein SAMN04488057_10857 [Cyclobacterium lianum]|uniref:Uncharacterized protein n=1 Tax=Cyclobacterium lianum TaxID=388280 RepID=A0A1M7PD21_9BACT|nr:hypothetical protein SAMN04488057_10857 [Cyclobacterium lianum]